ncbi:MAG: methyltransferase domain-containing protein [Clostridiales bacterium]|nr:methyltransferase domain-containing protein [Clostridiales bacterium]
MWNVALYNKFSKERIQPSKDLAERLMVENCKRVIDIGCGSGMSTYCIRNRFPNAEIVGVDLSASMLKKAKELVEGVAWIQRDCRESLEDLGTFDVVFANAFLQWLDDQEKFIKNAGKLLNKKGVLAIQVPNFREMKIAEILDKVVERYDSKHTLFSELPEKRFNYTAEEYYDMFSKYYSDVEMWQTYYYHPMADSDAIVEFIQGTTLRPYLACLSAEQGKEFLDLLRQETAIGYKSSKNGKVLFPFHRLFFLAKL